MNEVSYVSSSFECTFPGEILVQVSHVAANNVFREQAKFAEY